MSAPMVTINWTGSNLTKESLKWIARESWVVTGYTDKSDAIEAACSFNFPHWDNPNLTAGKRWAEPMGPVTYKVFAEFTFGDHGLCAQSPVGENEKFQWIPTEEIIPVDTDLSGNPILNSAGDVFSQAGSRPVPTVALRVWKWLPFYNVQTALQFQDCTNSNSFNITGAGGVTIGQAYCHYIRPVDAYTLSAPYVYVEYEFFFRPGTNPWQYRVSDRGRSGWYNDPISSKVLKGPIVDDSINPVPFDVALDGTGRPIHRAVGTPAAITTQGYWILGTDRLTKYAPVSNPNLPPGMTIDTSISGAIATTLIYNNILAQDFSALSL